LKENARETEREGEGEGARRLFGFVSLLKNLLEVPIALSTPEISMEVDRQRNAGSFEAS
jgi:hypothetical protein